MCHELYKYEWNGTDYLLKIKEPRVNLLDYSKLNKLYENGYNQTKEKIEEIKNCIK